MKDQIEKTPNKLISESSPYLLQHAYNPVDWHAWNQETLDKAKKENKLILVSIGYSACHWCHVMERESFEDHEAAEMMNKNFICIKVDREERPDIDQVYMLAVQLMTGQGGWPLNCFALPDGRPVYGGTYFPKSHWMQVLNSLAQVWENEPEKTYEYAARLAKGIKESSIIHIAKDENKITVEEVKQVVEQWKSGFDNIHGGPDKAPKFPLPNNYLFLLRYYAHSKDESILNHIVLTLDKMARGGIYDQIGGGFTRYSTDVLWKVPHFEKMLYDNGQMISLYSEAFHLTKKKLYKDIVYETIEFITRELKSESGGYFCALDADSEGVEGKFYVWKKEELKSILQEDYDLYADYYSVNKKGYWEDDVYIPLISEDDKSIREKYHLSEEQLENKINSIKKKLLQVREDRVRPGLDDKILTSWNALVIKGLTDAYLVFGDPAFLKEAISSMEFLLKNLRKEDGSLYHNFKNGKATINGFLEDYCFVIDALTGLYRCSYNEEYIMTALELLDYTTKHFSDESPMLYFTSDLDPSLVTRKAEIHDNVIPATNSVMANNFFHLGLYTGNIDFLTRAESMLNAVKKDMKNYGTAYSNWAILGLNMARPYYEIIVSGPGAEKKLDQIREVYFPFYIDGIAKKESRIAPFIDKASDQDQIFICEKGTCHRPVETADDAINQLI